MTARARSHVIRYLVIAVAAVALLPVSLIESKASAAIGPCTDVQFIGLRGSNERMLASQHDMGALVGPMADKAASLATGGSTVSFYGLPYPASSAGIVTFLDQEYFHSEHQGRDMLHSYLASITAACPDMKLVVMGYSQGAHAAGDDLATEPSSIINHVAEFVMFGDPRFNPDATSYTFGTFDPRDHGLAGPRSLGDFSGWDSRVSSWCNRNDIVCQGIGKGHSPGQHSQALYLSNYSAIVASFIRKAVGWAFKKPNLPLDLAFAIDSTGSMARSIDGAKTAASQMASTLSANGVDFRVGLVDYKDTNQGDPYAARVDTAFTNSLPAFSGGLSAITASGGGDYPEAVYSGLMTAINKLSWRNGAHKAIIVMGDAPGKDPEPVTGFTRATVLAAARALDPAAIYPVPIGTDPVSFFQPLADGSNGKLFEASDPSQVSDELLAAVESASTPLAATLTVGSPARPGEPVQFSAAGSWYDSGAITSYSWDFNGDGTPDATTTTNRVSHIYTTPFTGTATVTVTTDDGHSATANAPVDIRDDAPTPAGPPLSLQAVAGSDRTSIAVSWAPPADLGGGTIVGYEATLTDSTTGSLVAAQTTDATTTSLTFKDLPAGQYVADVWAGTEAGAGAVAATSVSLGAYDFTGFFPPVANPPTINQRHAGAAVPLKFSLSGNQGLKILAPGSPSSVQVSCSSEAPIGTPLPVSSPGHSGLTYDASSDTYTFVWKTDRAWAGTCRRIDLTLNDGTTHSAQMRFS